MNHSVSPAAAHASGIDPAIIAAEKEAKKTSTSRGERLFDWLTYGGIAFAGVFLAGIPITYFAKYGKGAKTFHKTAQSLEKMGLSAKTAEDMVIASVLMQPGNLGLLPVKIMENNKPELVGAFNRMLGDKSGDASIEEDPKQTWGSLVKGRGAAWLAAFVGFRGASIILGGNNFEYFENKFGETTCKLFGKPTHTPGSAKIIENETKAFRYGKIAALDVFATAAAAILLYAGSRIAARSNEHWRAKHMHINGNGNGATKPVEETLAQENTEEKAAAAPPGRCAPCKSFTVQSRPSLFTEALAARPAVASMPARFGA